MSQLQLHLDDGRLPAWCRIVRDSALYLARPQLSIRQPEQILEVLAPKLTSEEQEVFVVLTIDAQAALINMWEVTRGLVSSTLIHPREVFRRAIADNATAVIVAHNHPSGDPTPSAEDRTVTRTLRRAGELIDIPVYDHVIVAGDRYLSFAAAGLL